MLFKITSCSTFCSTVKPYKWTYLNEVVERGNNSRQITCHFRITNALSKPRHVFVFMINTANIESQTANPFLYNTFSVSTDPRTLDTTLQTILRFLTSLKRCNAIRLRKQRFPRWNTSKQSKFGKFIPVCLF